MHNPPIIYTHIILLAYPSCVFVNAVAATAANNMLLLSMGEAQ